MSLTEAGSKLLRVLAKKGEMPAERREHESAILARIKKDEEKVREKIQQRKLALDSTAQTPEDKAALLLLEANGIPISEYQRTGGRCVTDLEVFQVPGYYKMLGLSQFTSLRRLEIMLQKITTIEGLDNCVNLEVLYLNDNLITEVSGLGALRSLRELYIARNHISKIPHNAFASLASLQVLDLSNNRIQSLNGALRPLTELTTLNLAGNQLECVASDVLHLRLLKSLNLAGNPISSLTTLGRLAHLPALARLDFADPNYGYCPVTKLNHYRTFALAIFSHRLKILDTEPIYKPAAAAARAVVFKKQLYYTMRKRSIQRVAFLLIENIAKLNDVTNSTLYSTIILPMVRALDQARRVSQELAQPNFSACHIMRELLPWSSHVYEHYRAGESKQLPGSESNEDGDPHSNSKEEFPGTNHDELAALAVAFSEHANELLGSLLAELSNFRRCGLSTFSDSVMRAMQLSIMQLDGELETGGNLVYEEGIVPLDSGVPDPHASDTKVDGDSDKTKSESQPWAAACMSFIRNQRNDVFSCRLHPCGHSPTYAPISLQLLKCVRASSRELQLRHESALNSRPALSPMNPNRVTPDFQYMFIIVPAMNDVAHIVDRLYSPYTLPGSNSPSPLYELLRGSQLEELLACAMRLVEQNVLVYTEIGLRTQSSVFQCVTAERHSLLEMIVNSWVSELGAQPVAPPSLVSYESPYTTFTQVPHDALLACNSLVDATLPLMILAALASLRSSLESSHNPQERLTIMGCTLLAKVHPGVATAAPGSLRLDQVPIVRDNFRFSTSSTVAQSPAAQVGKPLTSPTAPGSDPASTYHTAKQLLSKGVAEDPWMIVDTLLHERTRPEMRKAVSFVGTSNLARFAFIRDPSFALPELVLYTGITVEIVPQVPSTSLGSGGRLAETAPNTGQLTSLVKRIADSSYLQELPQSFTQFLIQDYRTILSAASALSPGEQGNEFGKQVSERVDSFTTAGTTDSLQNVPLQFHCALRNLCESWLQHTLSLLTIVSSIYDLLTRSRFAVFTGHRKKAVHGKSSASSPRDISSAWLPPRSLIPRSSMEQLITAAPQSFHSLLYLDLTACSLQEIPEVLLESCPNVRHLILRHNSIRSLQPLLGNLDSCSTLESPDPERSPKMVGRSQAKTPHLVYLETLDISFNSFSSIIEIISVLRTHQAYSRRIQRAPDENPERGGDELTRKRDEDEIPSLHGLSLAWNPLVVSASALTLLSATLPKLAALDLSGTTLQLPSPTELQTRAKLERQSKEKDLEKINEMRAEWEKVTSSLIPLWTSLSARPNVPFSDRFVSTCSVVSETDITSSIPLLTMACSIGNAETSEQLQPSYMVISAFPSVHLLDALSLLWPKLRLFNSLVQMTAVQESESNLDRAIIDVELAVVSPSGAVWAPLRGGETAQLDDNASFLNKYLSTCHRISWPPLPQTPKLLTNSISPAATLLPFPLQFRPSELQSSIGIGANAKLEFPGNSRESSDVTRELTHFYYEGPIHAYRSPGGAMQLTQRALGGIVQGSTSLLPSQRLLLNEMQESRDEELSIFVLQRGSVTGDYVAACSTLGARGLIEGKSIPLPESSVVNQAMKGVLEGDTSQDSDAAGTNDMAVDIESLSSPAAKLELPSPRFPSTYQLSELNESHLNAATLRLLLQSTIYDPSSVLATDNIHLLMTSYLQELQTRHYANETQHQSVSGTQVVQEHALELLVGLMLSNSSPYSVINWLASQDICVKARSGRILTPVSSLRHTPRPAPSQFWSVTQALQYVIVLDLTGLGLTSLDAVLLAPGSLPSVRTLKLSGNRLTSLRGIEKCVELRELFADDNNLKSGKDSSEDALAPLKELAKYQKLRQVDFSQNPLGSLESLAPLGNSLVQVSLERCSLTSLAGVELLTNCAALYLAHNHIATYSEINRLKQLPKLVILDLSGNEVTCGGLSSGTQPLAQRQVPLVPHQSSSTSSMQATNRDNTQSPNEYRLYTIFNLKHLKALDGQIVEEGELAEARSRHMGRLTMDDLIMAHPDLMLSSLETLNLEKMKLRYVEVITASAFPMLRTLILDNNMINSINAIRPLPELRVLRLNYNRIASFVSSEDHTTSLGDPVLDTSCHEFDTVAKLFPKLEVLELAYNRIVSVNALQLGSMTRLVALGLEGNQIAKIPAFDASSGAELPRLYHLALSKNKVRRFDPGAFAGLNSLRELQMQENGLRSLQNLSPLPALTALFLAGNRISEISEIECLAPEFFPKLTELSLKSNPIARKQLYRPATIYKLTNLRVLDAKEITQEERSKVMMIFTPPELLTPATFGLDSSVLALGGVSIEALANLQRSTPSLIVTPVDTYNQQQLYVLQQQHQLAQFMHHNHHAHAHPEPSDHTHPASTQQPLRSLFHAQSSVAHNPNATNAPLSISGTAVPIVNSMSLGYPGHQHAVATIRNQTSSMTDDIPPRASAAAAASVAAPATTSSASSHGVQAVRVTSFGFPGNFSTYRR